jgi:hypothetical protein
MIYYVMIIILLLSTLNGTIKLHIKKKKKNGKKVQYNNETATERETGRTSIIIGTLTHPRV